VHGAPQPRHWEGAVPPPPPPGSAAYDCMESVSPAGATSIEMSMYCVIALSWLAGRQAARNNSPRRH